MPPDSAPSCEAALRQTLTAWRGRTNSEVILDALIDVLVTETQRRGDTQRAAHTLESVADELRAASRPRSTGTAGYWTRRP